MEISIPVGAILLSDVPSEQNMVIRRLHGLLVTDTAFQPTSTINMIDDEPHSYFIESYSLNLDKANPSRTTTFAINESTNLEVLHVLKAADSLPEASNDVFSIQAAIWVITEDVTWADLVEANLQPNLELVRNILLAAGFEPQCGQIFGGPPCTIVGSG